MDARLVTAMVFGSGIALTGAATTTGASEREGRSEPVRIEYEAPTSCPNRAALFELIERRTSITLSSDETEPAREIRIRLTPSAADFVGTMDYVDVSGHDVSRSITAADCDQALAAVALVAVIAIESRTIQPSPTAEASPAVTTRSGGSESNAPQARPELQSAAESQEKAVQNSNARRPSVRPSAPTPSLANSARVPEPASPSPSNVRVLHQEAGVLGGLESDPSPGLAFGGGLFWGIGRGAFPILRTFATWHEHRIHSTPQLDSHFRVIAFAPQVCAHRSWASALDWAIAFCGGFELGQYLAEGRSSDATMATAFSHRLLWAAAELAVPVRAASSGLFLELQPTVRFPLISGTFVVRNPDQSVYHVKRAAPGLGLAIGITFP